MVSPPHPRAKHAAKFRGPPPDVSVVKPPRSVVRAPSPLQAGEVQLIRLQILRIVLLRQEIIGKSDFQRRRAFRVLVKRCLRKDPVELERSTSHKRV